MAIFSLKKYEPVAQDQTKQEIDSEQNDNNEKYIYIRSDNTISDIIINILYKNFGKENVQEVEDDSKSNYDVEVVSTETINLDFVKAFKNIRSNNIFVFSNNKPFKTVAEEWFLTNTSNRNLIVTVSDFISTLKRL